jgi:hypothetical protein
MKARAVFLLALIAFACGKPDAKGPLVSKDPISVRGWVVDVEGNDAGMVKTVETEAARKMQLFQSLYVWVDGAPYVSGGYGENGAFLLLDVPPGNVTISFAGPGTPEDKVVLQNVPGNADVFLGGVLLKKNGTVALDPASVKVRLTAKIDRPRPTGLTAMVGELKVPVTEVPLAQMTDRHDWPTPPGPGFHPLATVR